MALTSPNRNGEKEITLIPVIPEENDENENNQKTKPQKEIRQSKNVVPKLNLNVNAKGYKELVSSGRFDDSHDDDLVAFSVDSQDIGDGKFSKRD